MNVRAYIAIFLSFNLLDDIEAFIMCDISVAFCLLIYYS